MEKKTNFGNSDHGFMHSRRNAYGSRFKVWVRTGISGILCDFDTYQGSVNRICARSELGMSGVVMKLTFTLPQVHNYKIYADNYFTCIPLIV